MNVENILKLADYLETLDEDQYDQRTLSFFDSDLNDYCPGCIAGHAIVFSRKERGAGRNYININHLREAENFLSLTDEQQNKLFDSYPLNETKIQICDAVGVLRHLAETGEVEWR